MNKNKILQNSLNFTETYKLNYNKPPALREAACLKAMYPATLEDIKDEDLLAGNNRNISREHVPVGFGSETSNFGYYCKLDTIEDFINDQSISEEDRYKWQQLYKFWEQETTTFKARKAFPREILSILDSDAYAPDPDNASHPLYRMAGIMLDYKKLLKYGLDGLKQLVNKKLKHSNNKELFTGMLTALETISDTINHYWQQAIDKAKSTNSIKRYQELNNMAASLHAIKHNPPQHFRDALQLVWIYTIVTGTINLGRLDDYLGPFYIKDIKNNHITAEEALTLLESLWHMIHNNMDYYNARVIIGGRGREFPEDADKLIPLCIQATINTHLPAPQLTLRFDSNTNPEIMDMALNAIGKNCTFPMLYNDDINIPAVMKAFDVPEKDAEQYLPYGCGEYILNHRSIGTPNTITNILKILELALFNGVCQKTGKQAGPQTGCLTDFETFDQLFQAFEKQSQAQVDALATAQSSIYKTLNKDISFLLISILFDDCIEREKALLDGGVKHLGGSLETYGNVSCSDSLTAIKDLVFDKKIISKEKLLEILSTDFKGYEREQQLLLNAPKYGNDHELADSMAQKVHEMICHQVRDQKHRTSMDSFLVVVINNNNNVIQGHSTIASADGRNAYTAMNNANSPVSGRDRNGITAMLNSLVKLPTDIHAGAVQNIKFSKKMFNESRQLITGILNTYFHKGGQQAMITVIGKEDLEAAMDRPEEYANLLVRVGGFSEYFVRLSKEDQLDILKRTCY